MPQPVGPDTRHPGPGSGAVNCAGDRVGRHLGARSPGPQEQRPAAGAGPAPLAVAGQSLADVGGYRQALPAVSLARDGQLPGAPVDIIELDGRDLASAQAKPCHHHDHGVVTPAQGSPPVEAGQQPRHLASSQPPLRGAPAPAGDRQHRRRQLAGDVPLHVQVPQQRPQPGHHAPRRCRAAPPVLLQHERRHVTGGQLRQGQLAAATPGPPGQELPGHPGIVADAALGQGTLARQVTAIGGKQLIRRGRRRHRRQADRPGAAQMVQKRAHGAERHPGAAPGRTPLGDELLCPGPRQRPRVQPPSAQPRTQLTHQPQMPGGRLAAVTLLRQLSPQPARVWLQRAFHPRH